jgi:hypothetical protein
MKYTDFVSRKLAYTSSRGIDPSVLDESHLFPHQSALTRWALMKGKSAIFANTGLGKTRMEITWADAICRAAGGDVLMLAPLAVAEQTREEGEKIGIAVNHARKDSDIKPGINIINYERLHLMDASRFVGIVMDESSRIKHDDSKTLKLLMDAFGPTEYKLCATATPAPNDWTELGTHAQFLGVCTVSEMLAEFFVHDGGDTQAWRLKGHARQAFWKWVASWGAMIQSPADLGFDATAYDLPPLRTRQVTVASDAQAQDGLLFALEAQTLTERRQAKRDSLIYRVRSCAEEINASDEPWLVWCELNAEGDAITSAVPDAVEIRGSDTTETKEQRLMDFVHGKIRVLVSKPKIAGWGLNFQHCRNIAFLGATDSFEGYYQAIRRCWRFGQTKPVNVVIYASDIEGAILRNLERKQADAEAMFRALSAETAESVRAEIMGSQRQSNEYKPKTKIAIPPFMAQERRAAA